MALPQLPPFPTLEEVEAYFRSLENYVPAPSDVHSFFKGVYDDLVRFGPPEVPLPKFERFLAVVPAPPPPPPPPKTSHERAMDWIKSHKHACIIAGLATVGAVGLGAYHFNATRTRLEALQRRRQERRRKRLAADPTAPKEIIVLLGADSVPYGPLIVKDLQKAGFIVIASVMSEAMADALERDTEGYVRAVVLDPEETGSISHFLRSLSSSLSLRFPITSHGDPYQSITSSQGPGGSLYRIAAVVSLLSLAPYEYMTLSSHSSPLVLSEHAMQHITSRALTPLSIIQSSLPLIKHRRALGAPAAEGRKTLGPTVILCVPSIAKVGVVGGAAASMAVSAASQGFDVMRRETSVDASLSSSGVSFVTIEVGEVGPPRALDGKGKGGRTPSEVRVLTDALLGVVAAKRSRWTWDWWLGLWLGNRRRVGAGSLTYAYASKLPAPILDFLLVLPHRLQRLQASLQRGGGGSNAPPTTARTTTTHSSRELPPLPPFAVDHRSRDRSRTVQQQQQQSPAALGTTDPSSATVGAATSSSVSASAYASEADVSSNGSDDGSGDYYPSVPASTAAAGHPRGGEEDRSSTMGSSSIAESWINVSD